MGQQGSTAVKKELLAKTSYNPAELDELYREFKRLDKDKSGQLDRTEFAALFNTRMKGSTPEQIDQLFVIFDSDKSGTISFSEMATALSVLSKGDNETKLRFLFRSFDTDNSGTLTADELQKLLKQMLSVAAALGRPADKAESFVQGIMTKLDKDKDGTITLDEWVSVGLSTPSLLTLLIGA